MITAYYRHVTEMEKKRAGNHMTHWGVTGRVGLRLGELKDSLPIFFFNGPQNPIIILF